VLCNDLLAEQVLKANAYLGRHPMKNRLGTMAVLIAVSVSPASARTICASAQDLKVHSKCSLHSPTKYILYGGQEVVKVGESVCGGRLFAHIHRMHNAALGWARQGPGLLECSK
jgi:hypothetical protein